LLFAAWLGLGLGLGLVLVDSHSRSFTCVDTPAASSFR
jgi:hypothetical protein